MTNGTHEWIDRQIGGDCARREDRNLRPGRRQPVPNLGVFWDQQSWDFNITDCVRKLPKDPVIEVLGIDNPSLVTAVREGIEKPLPKELKEQNHIELVSMTIQQGEEMIVGKRLREILTSARKGKPA